MKNKGTIISGILFVLVCIFSVAVYLNFSPKTEKGSKEITITVTHANADEKTFTYQTDVEYLADVLIENELIETEKEDYGLYITAVDKETADMSKEQWWCITKNGETLSTGVDKTPIQDGDKFELTLKVGYDDF